MKRFSHADEYHTGIGCGGRKRARPFENVEPDRGSDSDRDAVGLTFSEAARITAVSTKKVQEPKQTLTSLAHRLNSLASQCQNSLQAVTY